ncbi:MAG: LysR family transcriptional regulator [Candidatus Accumulibacter sp.]|jgi:DNA-binding transcriptional LysR family regulator|nr:LysR family transcriptional regulator [Accumulibacter sp.]
MKYDLVDLRLFIAIAEAQNLTRGAYRANLAASSASHRILRLEEALGAPLLARAPRGVRLTVAGETLLRHAREVFARLEQMHADLEPFASGVRGHIRFWANTDAIHSYLPDDLAGFLRAYPKVSVTLEEHPSPDIAVAVARGEIDVGVVAGKIEGARIELLPYRADRLVLIVPAGHPLGGEAREKRAHFSDVVDYPFVMMYAGSAIHTFIMSAAAAFGHRINVRIQVRSFDAVCRMVGSGVGVGIVPLSALRTRGLRETPVVVEIEETWAKRDLRICVRERKALSGFAAKLVDTLLAASG